MYKYTFNIYENETKTQNNLINSYVCQSEHLVYTIRKDFIDTEPKIHLDLYYNTLNENVLTSLLSYLEKGKFVEIIFEYEDLEPTIIFERKITFFTYESTSFAFEEVNIPSTKKASIYKNCSFKAQIRIG